MHIAVIGFGNAGGKIADALLEYEDVTNRTLTRYVLAVNTAEIDLAKLQRVPEEQRLLIGQTDERAQGRGVGADPDLGAEVARQDTAEIERELDGVPFHDVDAFLVIAGLGGGTGSGGAPTISQRLRDRYAEPVYGLGVLPSEDEGGRPSLNAARSLQTYAESVDNLLLFDNEIWQQAGDTLESGYDRTNRELAKRVVTLLSPGEVDGSLVSETAMDSSDIKRTLATGGVSSIAYADARLEPSNRTRGLVDRFRSNGANGTKSESDHATKVYSLVRKAVKSRLTCQAEIDSAERSLIVVSGPPEELSRKGLERARQWLEDQTDSAEILAGDDPRRDADRVSAAVVLSNVTEVPRVDGLQEQAVTAKANIEAQESTRSAEIAELITDERNELDPV